MIELEKSSKVHVGNDDYCFIMLLAAIGKLIERAQIFIDYIRINLTKNQDTAAGWLTLQQGQGIMVNLA